MNEQEMIDKYIKLASQAHKKLTEKLLEDTIKDPEGMALATILGALNDPEMVKNMSWLNVPEIITHNPFKETLDKWFAEYQARKILED